MLILKFILLSLHVSTVFTEQRKYNEFKFQQNDYQLEFERVDRVRFNKFYMKYYNLVTFKYNRTCPAINQTFEFNVTFGQDLEIIVQAYMFLSNEYREFPMRFEVNFCHALTRNYLGIGGITKCGNFTGCPAVKGRRYHSCNWTPDQSQLPLLIPNGRYMIEYQGVYGTEVLFLIRGYSRIYRPIPIP